MTDQEIIDQVHGLMQSGFEVAPEKLRPEALLKEDLGLDSLDAVDMLVYLEDSLGQRIEGERLIQVKTLADVYALVRESLAAGSSRDDQAQARELDA